MYVCVWPSGLGVGDVLKPLVCSDPELGREKRKLSKMESEPLGQGPQVLRRLSTGGGRRAGVRSLGHQLQSCQCVCGEGGWATAGG